ncbi:MAG: winged helix-turn-helix domain-containing protein, partial [Nocardioidaceae bacterium]|nr:winged helix-turn-helix domain-containing protein [Nocardioidaceae bacterium]
MTVHRLSRRDARRLAVRAQLLDAPRPTDVLEVVRRLTFLQLDQTAAVAPNADLVLWSRLGSDYTPDELAEVLETQTLVDLHGLARPAEDLALHRAEMASWPGVGDLRPWQHEIADWVHANDACRRDLLERLRMDGPLPASQLPDTCVRPWRSSGWTNDKNLRKMLDFLVARGEVAAAGREGRERLWDLAERVYPDDPVVPLDEALRTRGERRLRSLGIARARTTAVPGEPVDVGLVGEEAVVEGVKGSWRVDPELLDQAFRGRAALLSPLDRLVYDRKRLAEIFEFDYQLEMYKPVAQRRWGYFALPVLYGDRLVGKLDATTERAEGVLRVDALHRDVDFSPTMEAAVRREIADLARWLDVEVVGPGDAQVDGSSSSPSSRSSRRLSSKAATTSSTTSSRRASSSGSRS